MQRQTIETRTAAAVRDSYGGDACVLYGRRAAALIYTPAQPQCRARGWRQGYTNSSPPDARLSALAPQPISPNICTPRGNMAQNVMRAIGRKGAKPL